MESISGDARGVIGISRSGRVRKKSSKLIDFQSPDHVEAAKHRKMHSNIVSRIKSEPELDLGVEQLPQFHENNYEKTEDDDDSDTNDDDEMIEDDNDLDDSDNNSSGYNDSSLVVPRRSIYMTEKTTKKKFMSKDGTIVFRKAQRKDKGKSRFTAYMLWAKDVRQEMLFTHPELDFSSISKRLGEMWQNVPSGEKYNWKRRAKRLQVKGKVPDMSAAKPTGNASKFINKGLKISLPVRPNADQQPVVKKTCGRPPKASTLAARAQNQITTVTKVTSSPVPSTTSPGMYKVTGQQPADIAAYLKLLGDSLTIIGERLKEHEGQIAVSGSLSVLLDSLLCSIGPLMCLTKFIPTLNINNDENTKDKLQNILDNIAYVMPGL